MTDKVVLEVIGTILGETAKELRDEVGARIAEVIKKVEAIPAGADGKDGRDGKDAVVEPEIIAKMVVESEPVVETLQAIRNAKSVIENIPALVAETIAEIPLPKDGQDGKDGADGTSVYPDEVTSLLLQDDGFLEKVKGEKGADGDTFNLTGGFDPTRTYRKGDIYIKDKATFLVGEERHHMIVPRVVSEKEIKEIVTKANGDLEAALIGLMTDYTKEATHGLEKRLDNLTAEVAKEFNFNTPTDEESVAIRIYRGDWRNGNYRAGDVVTTTQGLYIALVDTNEHPADGEAWELMLSKSTGSKGGSVKSVKFADGEYSGSLGLVNDAVFSGKVLELDSQEGITIKAPYVVIDSDNPIFTLPGAALGSALVVAGFDSAGRALMGWAMLPPPVYSVSDEATANVVIKAAGIVTPSAWVDVGLEVTLTQEITAGTGTINFMMFVSNPTTRTGVLELNIEKNAILQPKSIKQSIPANFAGNIALTVPVSEGYAANDVIKLVARVLSNSNDTFTLSMLASPTDPAVLRVSGNT